MTIPLGPYLHTNRASRFRTSAGAPGLNATRAQRDPRTCAVPGSAFLFGVSSTSSGFRSRRNVSETGRNDQDPSSRSVAVPPAVAAGGFAHDAAEFLGEMALIRECELGGRG